MRMHIVDHLKDDPWGGGNQFLVSLKKTAIKRGIYSEEPSKDTGFLFNGHQSLKRAALLRCRFPESIFIHRIDGPMNYRGLPGVRLDGKISEFNSVLANGTVFQSNWSRNENLAVSPKHYLENRVISNACDPDMFYPSDARPKNSNEKIKLISTSWSTNAAKGFDLYHHLDETLDFDRYHYTFVGRADREFKNIKSIGVLPSSELAKELRNHDIFVFASKREACSNSLLEALHCGLPCLAYNGSSNPELVKNGGVLFLEKNINDQIGYLAENGESYRKSIKVENINSILDQYMDYFEALKQHQRSFSRIATVRQLLKELIV